MSAPKVTFTKVGTSYVGSNNMTILHNPEGFVIVDMNVPGGRSYEPENLLWIAKRKVQLFEDERQKSRETA